MSVCFLQQIIKSETFEHTGKWIINITSSVKISSTIYAVGTKNDKYISDIGWNNYVLEILNLN